jgi:hypothetical protein
MNSEYESVLRADPALARLYMNDAFVHAALAQGSDYNLPLTDSLRCAVVALGEDRQRLLSEVIRLKAGQPHVIEVKDCDGSVLARFAQREPSRWDAFWRKVKLNVRWMKAARKALRA